MRFLLDWNPWLTWRGTIFPRPTAGEVIFADVLLLPNGMSKVGANA